MFQGFSQGTADFLWGLRFNNERSWFQAHKQEFSELVDHPLRELAARLCLAMGEEFPKLGLEWKVSRIYRDARRLHGRGPFKDYLWLILRRPTEDEGAAPCFYFEIAPEFCGYGMGCHDPAPITMAKLRARIDRDPKPLEQLLRKLERRGEFALEGQEYKRPKGNPGPLLFPWYNRRQISLASNHNWEGVAFTPELAQQVLEGFRFLVPYYQYLMQVAADPVPGEG